MNTKTFAQQSRNQLMDGVAKKLLYWGFDTDGAVLETPQKLSGGYSFRGEVFDDPNVPHLWDSLKHAVQHKGIEVVVEEAAYTWFNRIMAMRVLAKNRYDLPQLEYAEGLNTPIILQKARQGQYGFLNATEKQRLQSIIGDYNKEQEAFALLLIGYCHSHNTLNRVFGKIDDYTELLLPDNMLQDQGFLHLLNTTDAISDEQYKEVELVGWLYQFYISERKDEVFASFKKNKKCEAKDIPAVTAIFTPNWIVKYMVENTTGKIWLDKHPDSPLKSQMKYLVENESDGNSEPIINNIEELTLIDPACGSGHILVEGFELLYQMYMEEYYTPEEAVESILKNNLYGLDIDDRAVQLATFAILLKAAKQYPDVWNKDWLPNVHAMPEAQDFSLQEIKDFLGPEGVEYQEELDTALRLMKQAKNLGSTMKLTLSEAARSFIELRYTEIENTDYRDFNLEAVYQKLHSYIPVLLLLTKNYNSVVANPPYMGQKNMNADLKNYVNANYPLSKSDLFAVFMESTLAMNIDKGLMGMINQQSWTFQSKFKKLRQLLLKNNGLLSMLDLGTRVFEELSGEVVQSTGFIFQKGNTNVNGAFHRLTNYNSNHEKETHFLNKSNLYNGICQEDFNAIPGAPISYWVGKKTYDLFRINGKVSDDFDLKVGLQTGNNDLFRRSWTEINYLKSTLNGNEGSKWFPYISGGGFRKWYGNLEYVIDWENDGNRIINYKDDKGKLLSRPQNRDYYFKKSLCWSDIGSKPLGARINPEACLFDVVSMSAFNEDVKKLVYLTGFLSSHVNNYFLKITAPGMHYSIGYIGQNPLIFELQNYSTIVDVVTDNVKMSKKDWNTRETSWDFERSPLIKDAETLEAAYQNWQEEVTQDFFQLHSNEEELNRIFIDIYGLQDELTPEVPLKDITILQEELKKNDLEALEEDFRTKGATAIELPIDKGEVVSQFVSYAIGLFMGRYRLDKPGLNIAHPSPTEEELQSYTYNKGKVTIDEDAIVPLMGASANFADDAYYQILELLDTIWGHETRTENINFIQDCLNKDLEKFLVKDFWKYHCSMYKKKPIYWLFSSKKGAFQVLVYMHRMNAFTVEKIRANYLLEHLNHLRGEISLLEKDESSLTTQEGRKLDRLRKELQECEEYDLVLKDVADQQIAFDLDDGVTENYKLFEGVVAKIK